MKVLFIGDITGRTGRNAVKEILPKLKKDQKIDYVFANGENVTSGKGIKIEHYEEMLKTGIDYFTSGNHLWTQKEIISVLDDKDIKILRPANYPKNVPGRGWVELEKVILISLMGRIFTEECLDCPFRKFDEIYEEIRKSPFAKASGDKPIIVDFHAEATSEKRAFAEYVSERATAVLGTHTHVQTNDAQILNESMAFITDVGMVGAKDSILGVEKKNVIDHFLTALPWKLDISRGPAIFNAVLIEIGSNNKSTKIELIREELAG